MFRRGAIRSDFSAEIEAHIRLEADRYRERGLSEEEALAAARRAFGNVIKTEERFYESRRYLWWDVLRQDIRFAGRLLMKTPGWTAVAVLTVALGIGATSAIFSIVNTVLLRQLPFPHPQQLYGVVETSKYGDGDTASAPDYFTIRENLHAGHGSSIQEMAAYLGGAGANWTESDRSERLTAGLVTASFFPTLQVQTLYGRTFLAEDDRPNADRVVLLSYGLWQRRFGGDPAIVGQRIRLNRASTLVIGVMPRSFDFPQGSELWLPLALDEAQQRQRIQVAGVRVLARASASATATDVYLELARLLEVAKHEYPPQYRTEAFEKSFVDSLGIFARPLQEQVTGNMRPALLVFSGAVGLMLLIVCFTVANLMLARATARKREIAVRVALGAPRRRVVTQLLTESLLVSLIGGSVGLGLAWGAIAALNASRQTALGGLPEVSIDLSTAAFTLIVTVLTGLVFGAAPSLGSLGFGVRDALQRESRSASSRTGVRRMRQVLVVAQLGVSLTLLVGAGLLAKSFYQLRHTDPGFHPENVLTARLTLAGSDYASRERQQEFVRELLLRVGQLPGVETLAIGGLPTVAMTGGGFMKFRVEDRPRVTLGEEPETAVMDISPDYFRVLGVPLIQGRPLRASDGNDAPQAAFVNEAFSRRFFPGESPLGHRISSRPLNENDPAWMEIVGVVGDIRQAGLDQNVVPTVYRSFLQDRLFTLVFTNLLVHVSHDPASLIPSITKVVAEMDRDQPVFDVKTMEQRLADSLGSPRFDAALTGGFALIAAFLASIGVYGVMSYLVALRTSEIGIRLALGARRSEIVGLILREGVALALIGITMGVGGALGLSHYLAALLYGVRTRDPETFLMAVVTLFAAVMVACAIPGRRAVHVDPAAALRHD